MRNEFDFEPHIGGSVLRVLAAALAVVAFILMLAFLLQPAKALTIRALKIEPPWQIVEEDTCVRPLAVYIVIGQIFAKAGMLGPVTVKVLPPSDSLPMREYGRKGAAFRFQTRWRKDQCLHSFRSLYTERQP